MSRNSRGQVIENLKVENYAAEGKCIAKHEEKVIFLEYCAPGDIVDVQITHSKKSWAEAKVINYKEKSALRIEPSCEHFTICGGCKWQHIPYSEQTTYKENQVKDQFERIGKLPFEKILPIIGSNEQYYYRNKLDFTFSNKKWLTDSQIKSDDNFDRRALGFHIPGRFDKILDVSKCFLQADPSNQIRNELRNFCIENDFEFFDIATKKGFVRNLIIRTASTGDLMVIVQVFENQEKNIKSICDFLASKFPEITSLNYVVNPKMNETFHDLDIICVKGKPYIEEEMEELKFRIGPKTFYQTNSKQAYILYTATRNLAEIKETDLVYDLYTGAGTIANFVAKKAKKVVGVEYVPQAIEDAKINSEINGISNTVFYAGDMKNVLNDEFIAQNGKPDVIITDPPRAGMDEKVILKILEIAPKRIVYVSCNPATQARDLALMKEQYHIKTVQPVDMFPQTYHVENIVLLELK
ncbi:MAG: 23S rRNA (uracil(1939)-C(5))-methyltransferase RlmD [Cytophagales bacterium]